MVRLYTDFEIKRSFKELEKLAGEELAGLIRDSNLRKKVMNQNYLEAMLLCAGMNVCFKTKEFMTAGEFLGFSLFIDQLQSKVMEPLNVC